jgi:hypothetical protein
MGNIISNTSDLSSASSGGNSGGNLGINDSILNEDGTYNPFVQNITDILLELNLFNTGNYRVEAGRSDAPRSEFNYSYDAYNLNPPPGARSADTNSGRGRPIDINRNFVDIFGIPYVTTETPLAGDNDSSSSIPTPEYQTGSYNVDNAFYNIKRAVCNITEKIPVSMVGVDLPGDDPDMKRYINLFTDDNSRYLPNIIRDQKTKTYNLPEGTDKTSITTDSTVMSDMVNNCLTWGTITSTSGACIPDASGVCDPNTIPNTIPDLTPTSGLILNDYSNKTNTITQRNSESITTSPHNIYDQPLSEECVNLLDSMIINSFTTPKIGNYSKWTLSDKTNLNSIGVGTSSLIHDFSSNKIGIVPLRGNEGINATNLPTGFNPQTTNIFGMGNFSTTGTSTGSGTMNIAQADMNGTCQNFEQDLCKWYYYYDLQDGITANNDSVINNRNASNFGNNIQYLLSHIPDCRCQSYINSGGNPVNYDEYYWYNKCFVTQNFGQSRDDNNTSYPASSFAAGEPSKTMRIFNYKTNNSEYVAYRRQMDPIGIQEPGTTDKMWGFIANQDRTRAVTMNKYVCNMEVNNNISNTVGNVVVGNINMTCGAPQNCEGGWARDPNSQCNAQCNSDGSAGIGTYREIFTIRRPAQGGGNPCKENDRVMTNGEIREVECRGNPCPPGAVNCVGEWKDTEGATCSATCPQTNGTISKTWHTTTAASNGGVGCPSVTIINDAPCTIPCLSSSSNSSLDPIFISVNLIDPSITTATYSIPLEVKTGVLEPFTSVSANLTVNSAIVKNFTKNYDFLLFLVSDPSQYITCLYNGSSCSSDIEGACSPYIITIPFVYGSTTLIKKYNLGIRNKPNNYSNTITPTIYNIPLSIKQYSMAISDISVSIFSGNPYIVFTINPGTYDNIIGLSVRIVLTPTSETSPIISKNYPDLFSTLRNNNNVIMIGDDTIIQPIKYNYKIMINENVVNSIPVSYTDGYQMNYDQILPINQQESIDLSSIVSKFNSISLQYMNYNNNNIITNVLSNDTLLIGSTILFSWVFTNIDTSLTNISVYYDTDSTYIPSSTASLSSVLIKLSDLGILNVNKNNYSYSVDFICPFIITTQPIIFYAIASGSDPSINVYSNTIKVSLPNITSKSTIQNWKIYTNYTSSDMVTIPSTSLTPILKPNQTIATIDNYFSAGYDGKYSYIIYNPVDILWYGSNATPEPSTSTSNLSYTIFKNPYTDAIQPEIKITDIIPSGSTNSLNITSPITLEIGAELTLNYQIINMSVDPDSKPIINFQLILADKIIRSFNFTNSSGSITFTVFGDLSVLSPTLYLTSYGIWNSNSISLILNNSGSIRKTITNSSDTPPSSVIYTNINNPAINIVAPRSDTIISTLNVSYDVMQENQYFTQLSSFGKPLSINNMMLTFKTMNFLLPFLYIIHSSETEGFESKIYEPFTNTHQLYLESKKSRKVKTTQQKTYINSNLVESFTGSPPESLTIDTISFDFSLSTLDTLNNIQLMFSGYKSVTIQNLFLTFGNLSLDNKKFGISFVSNSQITTVFNILNIIFIGSLTSNIFLSNSIPGLEKVNYSANRLVNNKYALIVPLIYSNGVYNLPESYQSQLTNTLKISTSSVPDPIPVKPSITKAPESGGFLSGLSSGTGLSIMIIIIIGLIVSGIIGYLIYITVYPNKK